MAPGLTLRIEPVDYSAAEYRYIIGWSTNRPMCLVNLTEEDKRQVMRILMDDPAKDLQSNPIRDIIVHAVSNGIKGFELWEVNSYLKDADIQKEFITSPDIIKSEIRQHGTLIFAS